MARDRSLALVLPADRAAPTGGNLVNAALHAALTPHVDTRVVEPAALAADLAAAPPTIYLLDTLCLAALAAPWPERHRVHLLAHLLPSQDPTASAAARAAAADLLPHLDGAVAFSAVTAAALAADGLPPERIVVVQPGLPDWARPAPTPRPVAAPPRLLLVGNLSPLKGVAELLAALAVRTGAAERYLLRVVGAGRDPAYAARCAALAAAPPLAGRIELAGPLPHDALAAEYHAADLVVSAAPIETYGLALAEARASGVPLAVLDAGHAAAHVTAASGIVAPSLAALAAAVVALVGAPDRLAALAVAARAAATAAPRPRWSAAAGRLLDHLGALP
jgi:glycosyltransferase involved in cell wall biosynthesis